MSEHEQRLPECAREFSDRRAEIVELRTQGVDERRLLEAVTRTLEAVRQEIGELGTAVGDRLGGLERRTDDVQRRLEGVEARLSLWSGRAWAMVMAVLAELVGLGFLLLRGVD